MEVNVDKILKQKSPSLHKKLPRFLIRLLEKLVYQKRVNEMLEACEGCEGIDFVTKALDNLEIRREVVGLDIPMGEYIFVSNHPLGGLDGMALLEAVDKHYKGVRIMATDLLMHIEPMRELFLPVNKYGKQTESYANTIAEHFESGKAFISFPAGYCSRKISGKVQDTQWSRNYISKALRYKRSIVPVFVDEINSPLFYRLETIRKKLGLKLNIGTILLPHELIRRSKRKGSVRMIFGSPISHEMLTTKPTSEWNNIIRESCYSLGKN